MSRAPPWSRVTHDADVAAHCDRILPIRPSAPQVALARLIGDRGTTVRTTSRTARRHGDNDTTDFRVTKVGSAPRAYPSMMRTDACSTLMPAPSASQSGPGGRVTPTALLLDLVDTGSGQVSPVLLLAPILPVLGVAATWSRGLDPAYELTASVPRAGLYLVLRRTASVLGVVVPALSVGGWVAGVTMAQWLLPCLAFTVTTLALGGAVGVTRAAVVLAAVIVAPTLATSRPGP